MLLRIPLKHLVKYIPYLPPLPCAPTYGPVQDNLGTKKRSKKLKMAQKPVVLAPKLI